MKPETIFRQKVDRKLKTIPLSWWESIQQRTIHGTPDKIGVVNGRFVALELKATPTSKTTELQIKKIRDINKANGLGYIVHPGNVDEVIEDIINRCIPGLG
jgi:hypothetical protein